MTGTEDALPQELALPIPVHSETLNVPLRRLAAVSVLIAISAVLTAAVVVGINRADALASLALSLAILSFVLQIILYVLQSNLANQQLAQSQALNSETQKLLEELRVRAASTQDLLSGQFNRLLDKVLEKAVPEAAQQAGEKAGVDSVALERYLQASLRSAATEVTPRELASIRNRSRIRPDEDSRSEPSPEDLAILGELLREPSPQEREQGVQQMRSLSLAALLELGRFARDEVSVRTSGGAVGFPLNERSKVQRELMTAGLLNVVRRPEAAALFTQPIRPTAKWLQLTPAGRQAARVWLAESRGSDA